MIRMMRIHIKAFFDESFALRLLRKFEDMFDLQSSTQALAGEM